eukprot:1549882-Rhodomonas_salina.1
MPYAPANLAERLASVPGVDAGSQTSYWTPGSAIPSVRVPTEIAAVGVGEILAREPAALASVPTSTQATKDMVCATCDALALRLSALDLER